ncbi:SPRY-domain-containing protein [Yamadazyma tenuis ATCC 10573]|uniref:SPRY-domain-containing protein n=1 Tax=Candida tenuis (strain ATCC 10573 / BCRC 21748 / CBS 615 / JCM 9827 / NBRC 10315 / NRRL Y-1498 / VKM Y-70) TaxID=590646 RepID=G3B6F2_CANTC|nr:SPRY-domain-containing protein [Yamadazyma tenuis ATCC 10573]EGV63453.1 SPRY-domain-containing protein [Yamadazyma tenuis ATCC 10573]
MAHPSSCSLIDVSYPDLSTDRASTSDSNTDLVLIFVAVFSFLSLALLVSCIALLIVFIRRRLAVSEAELIRQEENQVYLELDSDEQELYFQSKEYLAENPYFRNDLTLSQNLLISEKGIGAWEFVKDALLTNHELLILNKYELNFFKPMECSVSTNLPIPTKNDVYYFESKVYSLPNVENTKISIGMGVRPYPWFRLPGRHAHSVSYDSDGHRRHNQPFKVTTPPPFPSLIEGDVVGVGYRVRSGTIFFTRNGKKLSESKLGGHIKHFKIPHEGQLYPIIGASNLCSIHVNLGQMGFVFIEANVKKWGFAPLEGNGPAPPAYNKFNSDILLERSEIDENDLSERDSDFPPDFWRDQEEMAYDEDDANDKFSYNAYSDANSVDERITLSSLVPPNMPPSYESGSDADDEGDEAVDMPSPGSAPEELQEVEVRDLEVSVEASHPEASEVNLHSRDCKGVGAETSTQPDPQSSELPLTPTTSPLSQTPRSTSSYLTETPTSPSHVHP